MIIVNVMCTRAHGCCCWDEFQCQGRLVAVAAISHFRPLINIHESNELLINIHRYIYKYTYIHSYIGTGLNRE